MISRQLRYRPTPKSMLDLQQTYTLRHYPIPSTINMLLVALQGCIYLGMSFGMPVLLYAYPSYIGLWFVLGSVVTMFQAIQTYAIVHEGCHCLLHHDKKVDYLLSRIMSICFATPMYIFKYIHMFHHRTNGTYQDVGRHELAHTSLLMTWVSLMGGAYITARVVFSACFLPQRYHGKVDEFLLKVKGTALRDMRVDMVVMLLMRIATLQVWGMEYLWLWLWFSWLGDFVISFYCPIFHQGGPMTDKWHGWNLYMPAPLRLWSLNFNMHQIHHLYPSLPWIYYPKVWKEIGAQWDASLWHGTLTQFAYHNQDFRMIRQQYHDHLESQQPPQADDAVAALLAQKT